MAGGQRVAGVKVTHQEQGGMAAEITSNKFVAGEMASATV